MKDITGQKIVIIGCGNVAWHIAKHLQALKTHSVFVYNHQPNEALNDFRATLKCNIAVGLENMIADADFYFICVSDKSIADVASKIVIENKQAVLLHTSGSARLKDLGNHAFATGIFYPLQTFSKADSIQWNEVPVIVEAETPKVQAKITQLAKQFTKTVKVLDYKERLKLHLAAVMVNNFTNALYVAASEFIGEPNNKEDLSILLPLIKQTTLKLEHISPKAAQTGPAKRNDELVLKKHLSLLSKQTDLKKIYKQLSKLIVHQQEKNHA